ncbi:MAG TPA: putative glycolipid-binding domain-containing protein [Longimicrobiales bacterium]|nr:putative glycolipid-binding domain-containing protein [Longimicrobiales bacterium]
MPDATGQLLHDVLWQRPDLPALEHCRLWQHDSNFSLTGLVLTRANDAPVEIQYTVICSADWRTRAAHIAMHRGDHIDRVTVAVDDSQTWRSNGKELTFANGLFDIDLGFSPSTNALPIRRLKLEIGGSKPVTAVWVRFPDLAVLTLEQRYTRLSADRYRYESANGSFVAELEVDHHGLVVTYGRWWERIAESAHNFTTAP